MEGTEGVVEYITGADLANYIATGTPDIAGSTETLADFQGGMEHIQLGDDATVSFEPEIDYFYDISSAPEPATMALMGSALIGLGLFASRLKRN